MGFLVCSFTGPILSSELIVCRVVAIVIGFCFFLIFFFVPETFWDRTPRRHKLKNPFVPRHKSSGTPRHDGARTPMSPISPPEQETTHAKSKNVHVGFAEDNTLHGVVPNDSSRPASPAASGKNVSFQTQTIGGVMEDSKPNGPSEAAGIQSQDYFGNVNNPATDPEKQDIAPVPNRPSLQSRTSGYAESDQISYTYTDHYRSAPPKSYVKSLSPWNGRLAKDRWHRVAIRPFILFAYPAVLWSSLVYALAVGWLIVLSESVAHIYEDRESYNFTALQVGLVYISPFVGGVLGTAVAGKISDIIVRFMARKNDGVYEPEFRLVMAIPITLSTVIGLMGFGWSAEEKNSWIVPTVFFGVISFGCSLASTTSVTFVVDSYRIYAGEALVTLNFCKSKFFRDSDIL